jgi:Glycosyl transferases group 1/Glycosyl transferase 4-like domain
MDQEIMCFATKGADTNEDQRIRRLLEPLSPYEHRFERAHKARSFVELVRTIRRRRPALVVMEGTGTAGGFAILLGRALWRIPFVVSSGDAVAPFIGASRPGLRWLAGLYERALYRASAGFIGWTPYLVGRALTMGAPRAMTAAGWAPYSPAEEGRDELRDQLGIPRDAIVFGLVGALHWNARVGYCYGMELVRALQRVERTDVAVLVAGDGSGRAELERAGGADLGHRLFLPGAIPQSAVPAHLAAMDVVSLPQSVDGVGSFRYTTKISEYVGARRPMVTNEIPLAYDLDDGWLWRMPGDSPWDERFVAGLAALMQRISPEEIAARRAAIPEQIEVFDPDRQQRQASAFVTDLMRRA